MVTRVPGVRLVRAGLVIAFWLVMSVGVAFGQPQRMAVFPGKYTFGSKGGRLPAACMDRNRDAPSPFDIYKYADSQLTFQRIAANGKPIAPPELLQTAINRGDVRLPGKYEIDHLPVEFPNLKPGEKAVIESEGLGLLAQDAEDGRLGRAQLKKYDDMLAAYHKRRTDLIAAVGEHSVLERRLESGRPRFLWGIQDDVGNEAVAAAFSSASRELSRMSGERAREYLAIVRGEPLTSVQVEAANRAIGLKIDPKKSYDTAFVAALRNYISARRILTEALGTDHPFVQSLNLGPRVLAALDEGADGTTALSAELKAVLDPSRGRHPELARDLLALTQGVRLTNAQATDLGRLADINLSNHDQKLQKHVVLTIEDGGSLRVDSVAQSQVVPADKLTPARLREVLGRDARVVVRGKIDPVFAFTLNQAGVYVVRDESAFLNYPLGLPAAKPQLIIVAAETTNPTAAVAINRTIWGEQQNGNRDLRRIFSSIGEARGGGAVIVESSANLKKAIEAAGASGSRPIVFFHNADGEIKFADGSSLPLRRFAHEYGRLGAVPLACSTFDVPEFEVKTTFDIKVASFVRGYLKAARATDGGNNPPPLDDFLGDVTRGYAGAETKQLGLLVIRGIGVGFVASASTGLAAYLLGPGSDDDKNKKEKEKEKEKE